MRNRNRILILLFVLLPIGLSAQISPGELTRAHASLEGISNCSKCHEVGKKVVSEKCLACHTEIRDLIGSKKGYHASTEVTGKDCFVCHNEHHGRNFQIIRFDTTRFDHRKAGYDLQGKHSRINCASCHKSAFVKVKSSRKSAGSYLGLGTGCLDCHADFHQQTLSANCMLCHNAEAFKPVTGFDHSKTKFPLAGRHHALECAKCHKVIEVNGHKTPKFKGIAFARCTDCHEDVHKNKFGQDCRKCHSEESFKKIGTLNTFNHDKTDYPLQGRHTTVACKSCHKESLTTKINFSRCSNCHQDYHKGQFNKPGKISDCQDCHSVNGFTNSSFTIERHNENGFPLTGPHLATPCFSCHKKGSEWVFKDLKKRCIDCHQNIHGDKIDPKYSGNDECANCHEVSLWTNVKFDHNKTDFRLTGKHAVTTCRKCHFVKDNTGTVQQRFSELDGLCTDCHSDEHNGQFKPDKDNGCSRCHNFEQWKPVSFNHDSARFKLDINHKDLACSKCHKPVTAEGRTYIQYKVDYKGDIRCINCHLR